MRVSFPITSVARAAARTATNPAISGTAVRSASTGKPPLDIQAYVNRFINLDETQKIIYQSAENFIQNEIKPDVQKTLESGKKVTKEDSRRWHKQMGEQGFFGVKAAQEYGGMGERYKTYGMVCRSIEKLDSGLRSIASVQMSLVINPIQELGNEDQRARFLPDLISGKAVGCFGLTEPGAGSDPTRLLTKAVKSGSGYILNGEKMWITNAPFADVAVVIAKIEGENKVGAFVVPATSEGFSTKEIEGKMSLQLSSTGSISMTDVYVPEENLLEKSVSKTFGNIFRATLFNARFGIGWGAVGMHEDVLTVARDYALLREQKGIIASKQLIQADLAASLSKLARNAAFMDRASDLLDNGKGQYIDISIGKGSIVEDAIEAANNATRILGANGITADFSPIRHATNGVTVGTYEGTSKIHSLIIGESLAGIPAF